MSRTIQSIEQFVRSLSATQRAFFREREAAHEAILQQAVAAGSDAFGRTARLLGELTHARATADAEGN